MATESHPPAEAPAGEPWQDAVRRGLRFLAKELRDHHAPLHRLVDDQRLPDAPLHEFCCEPEGGFEVSCRVAPDRATIRWGGWIHRLESRDSTADEVVGFVLLGLTTESRLTITFAGEQPVRWLPELRTDEGWEPLGAQNRLLHNWFAPRHQQTLQNDLLPWERYQTSADTANPSLVED